jgi:transcriptional regulator with XRE-family HTH domain
VTTLGAMANNPDGNRPDDASIRLGKDFGRRIELIVASRSILVTHLDRQIGVEKGTVSSLIGGRRGPKVTAVLVLRFADALDVDFDWLFTGRGSAHAFARKGFIACGIAATSSLWPKAAPRLAEPITSGPPPERAARKKPLRR